MNIWTSFFLVLSVVALAYPFLVPDDHLNDVEGSLILDDPEGWNDEEVELDLACGRLTRADHEGMEGQETGRSSSDVP